MVRKIIFVVFPAILSLQACFMDAVDSGESRSPVDDSPLYLDTSNYECNHTRTTGCIQGHVPAAPVLYVEGIEFFDADDLRLRFNELVTLSSADKSIASDDIKLKLLTPISNRNFGAGFEVYIKGISSRAQDVLKSGQFAVHRLPAGLYEIRVQKQIRFEIYESSSLAEENIEKEITKKTFCGTLYSESEVEVQTGKRTATKVFDDFNFHIKNIACDKKDERSTELTL